MAALSRFSTFSSPKLSNPLSPYSTTPIAAFRSMERTKPAMVSMATDRGSLSSLRGGAGLLERPGLDQSQFDPLPQAEEGGDIGRLCDKKGLGSGDSYRVLLVDDARHTENFVAKALPQAVPSVTAGEARELFHASRQIGVSVVIVTVKEHAEFYAQMMIRCGLRAAIEPGSCTA